MWRGGECGNFFPIAYFDFDATVFGQKHRTSVHVLPDLPCLLPAPSWDGSSIEVDVSRRGGNGGSPHCQPWHGRHVGAKGLHPRRSPDRAIGQRVPVRARTIHIGDPAFERARAAPRGPAIASAPQWIRQHQCHHRRLRWWDAPPVSLPIGQPTSPILLPIWTACLTSAALIPATSWAWLPFCSRSPIGNSSPILIFPSPGNGNMP